MCWLLAPRCSATRPASPPPWSGYGRAWCKQSGNGRGPRSARRTSARWGTIPISPTRRRAWYNCGMNATSILDRFLEPVTQLLPAETARQIIDLRIDPQLQARLDVLAEKANCGTLSDIERDEYAEY